MSLVHSARQTFVISGFKSTSEGGGRGSFFARFGMTGGRVKEKPSVDKEAWWQ